MLRKMDISKFSKIFFSSILVDNLGIDKCWLYCCIPGLVISIQNEIGNWLLVMSLRNWWWGTVLFDGTSLITTDLPGNHWTFGWAWLLSPYLFCSPRLVFWDWLACQWGCRLCLPVYHAQWLAALALQRCSCCSQTAVHLWKPCCSEQGVRLDEVWRSFPAHMVLLLCEMWLCSSSPCLQHSWALNHIDCLVCP